MHYSYKSGKQLIQYFREDKKIGTFRLQAGFFNERYSCPVFKIYE